MRRKLMTLALACLVVGGLAKSAKATNGDDMIGVDAVSRAMGGIGVGMPLSSTDALYRNPAWMSAYKGFNVSFGSTIFLPKVKSKVSLNGTTLGESNSLANKFVIPEFAITQRVNNQLVVGLGAFGVSGMGADYRNAGTLFQNSNTNFAFMRMMGGASYQVNDFLSLGGALHMAWGSLDMGAGYSQAFGVGASLGVAADMQKAAGLPVTVGLSYMTPVRMTYKRVFDINSVPGYAGIPGNSATPTYKNLKLEQPQEVAAGIGVQPMENLKIGFDVRWINWANADGYKQFMWKNQTVFAVGAEYKPMQALALRAGFNYAKTPIKDVDNDAAYGNTVTNIPDIGNIPNVMIPVLDALGFPAITETHLTLGAGYKVTKNLGVNFAYVHAFEKTLNVNNFPTPTGALVDYQTKNSQNSISFSLDWNF